MPTAGRLQQPGDVMPTLTYHHRTFDARPDRIDLRDRIYLPKLVSLPPYWPQNESIDRYLPAYAGTLVLDQGEEGACTGFGLAAAINFLARKNNGFQVKGTAASATRPIP
jgi:hypothetical protein